MSIARNVASYRKSTERGYITEATGNEAEI